ncbi:MAG: TetR/AcrR family transcriptional regulator [Bdellovibrionaceae bacterium]|nr:TetR family transcriptional regulator [Bdellovibrionales bacterium]MCB9083819.1 TetR/AcrR family transcriptional regulator [Pseudobdellovibrionaceae bacterium]
MKEGLEEILNRCSLLMARKGYYGTSMRDLAKETGYSLSGLYNYFKSKEELLFLINLHGFSAISSTLRVMLEKLDEPEERMYALIYNHIKYFLAHMNEMRVLMLGTQNLDVERSATIRDLKEEYRQQGQLIVADLFRAKTGKKLSKKELEKKTLLLFGMMNWVFGWYSPRMHGTADDLIDDIYSLFLRGLLVEREKVPNVDGIKKVYEANKTKFFLAEAN